MTRDQAIQQIQTSAARFPMDSAWLVKRRDGYAVLNWPGAQPGKAEQFFDGKPVSELKKGL